MSNYSLKNSEIYRYELNCFFSIRDEQRDQSTNFDCKIISFLNGIAEILIDEVLDTVSPLVVEEEI